MMSRFSIAKKILHRSSFNLNSSIKLNSSSSSNSKILIHDKYKAFSFDEIHKLSRTLSNELCSNLNQSNLNGEKIAVLCANNYTYMISILAIWMANGVPIGLNKLYPNHLIEYFINDSKCKLVINGCSDEIDPNQKEFEALLAKYKVVNYQLKETSFYSSTLKTAVSSNVDSLEEIRNLLRLEEVKQKEGIILYTSGTSGPPKGVVSTRFNLLRLIETLIKSWEITPKDNLLHVLPLNHVHGLSFGLLTFSYAGAQITMMPKFNAEQVWMNFLDPNNTINSFLAVPTIYVQLVAFYLNNSEFRRKFSEEKIRDIFKRKMRLIGSGSASLNVKTSEDWERITGYRILERYGSTEMGLGLSNPYRETETQKRMAGAVGRPYGNTKVRIVEPNEEDNDSKHVLVESDHLNDKIVKIGQDKRFFGELQVKGDMIFKEYLNKPKQTKETFSNYGHGWFKTGDTSEYLPDSRVYRIIGRTSVDVIKSGGFKISALDVEREILANEWIEEVSVLGLSDPVWGQRVFAVMILKPNVKYNQEEFIKWCKTRMPKYSVPTVIKVVDKIAKNQLGKVNKKELLKLYENEFKK